VDSSLVGCGGCPTTDSRKSTCYHKRHGGTFCLESITGQPSTSALATQSTMKGRQQNQQLIKQVLSRELQLYYTRLTSTLLPPAPEDYVKRTAALVGLRHDAGPQALLPYLMRWVSARKIWSQKSFYFLQVSSFIHFIFLFLCPYD